MAKEFRGFDLFTTTYGSCCRKFSTSNHCSVQSSKDFRHFSLSNCPGRSDAFDWHLQALQEIGLADNLSDEADY